MSRVVSRVACDTGEGVVNWYICWFYCFALCGLLTTHNSTLGRLRLLRVQNYHYKCTNIIVWARSLERETIALGYYYIAGWLMWEGWAYCVTQGGHTQRIHFICGKCRYMFWSVCNWVIFKYLANGCVGGVQLSGFVLCNKEVIKMKLWCVTGFWMASNGVGLNKL